MAWIQVEQTLPTDKKTLKLKRALNISAPYAMGIITTLWLWCIDNAPDGDITDLDGDDLADICDYPDSGEKFLNALINSGFVINNGEQTVIANWYERVGQLMDKRESQKEKARERQQAYRQRKKSEAEQNEKNNDCDAASQPVTDMSRECHNNVMPCHTPIQYSKSNNIYIDGDDSYTRACACEESPDVENCVNNSVSNPEDYKSETNSEFRVTYLTPEVRRELENLIRTRAVYHWERNISDDELKNIAEELIALHGGHVKDFKITDNDKFLLTEAFKSSSLQNACRVSYICGIYKNYRQRNIRTVNDYYDYSDRSLHLVGAG